MIRGSTRRAILSVGLMVGVLALPACRGESSPPTAAEDHGAPMTPDRFVEIVSAIRTAERETAEEDSAAALFEERRREILDRYGADAAMLEEFIRHHAEDTELLRTVWDQINERLKHEVAPKDDPFERPGFRVQ